MLVRKPVNDRILNGRPNAFADLLLFLFGPRKPNRRAVARELSNQPSSVIGTYLRPSARRSPSLGETVNDVPNQIRNLRYPQMNG